jgi:hypothetical protein
MPPVESSMEQFTIIRNGTSCTSAEYHSDQEGGVSFWKALHTGEIVGRGCATDHDDASINNTLHGWSPGEIQCDLAGCLARLSDIEYIALDINPPSPCETLIHTLFNPSSEEQQQTHPCWLLTVKCTCGESPPSKCIVGTI